MIFQIALILLTGALFTYLILATSYYMSSFLVGLVLVIAVIQLVRNVDATNRKLARFLLAVRHTDFTQSFSSIAEAQSFADLAAAMDEVVQRFQEARRQREEQAIFLRALVEHVPIALFAIRETGDITLFNNAARRLLMVGGLHNIRNQPFGESFSNAVIDLQPGEQALLRVSRNGELRHLKLSAALLRHRGGDEKLLCIQDLSTELEARELETIETLIRVLTHEIMNSITPITSLAETAAQGVGAIKKQLGAECEVREMLDDVHDAVQTISSRGGGMLRFVNIYREMMQVPNPEMRNFPVAELFARVDKLMRAEAIERGIKLLTLIDPDTLEITADPELLEQVLINLVRNSFDALENRENPVIEFSGRINRSGQVELSVRDNGCGLTDEARERLFVPFFTTKRRGSGVGMSIARQIIRLHHGSVGVESERGTGTTVALRF